MFIYPSLLILGTRPAGNHFQLGDGLLPAIPISPDSLLVEYPPEKSGWQISEEEKTKQTPSWKAGVSFVVDVYLGGW